MSGSDLSTQFFFHSKHSTVRRESQHIKSLKKRLLQTVLQGGAAGGKPGPDGELAALEAVGIFDLPEKFGDPLLLGELGVHGHLPDICQGRTRRGKGLMFQFSYLLQQTEPPQSENSLRRYVLDQPLKR